MYYKLTNQEMQTYNDFQWELNKWYEIPEEDQGDELCTSSWFHCYNNPYLAVLLNPIHAKIENPRLFEIEVDGESLEDNQLKFGFTKMKLVREIELPEITLEQKVEFAIHCALEVCNDKDFVNWAENWLSGKDRTANYAAAYAAFNAFNAYAAAYAYAAASDASDAYAAAYAAANAARADNVNLIAIVNKVFEEEYE